MTFTIAIVIVVLAYTWVLGPIAPRWVRHVPAVTVVALAVWHALKSGEWGFRWAELGPALRWAAALTGAGVLALYLAGNHLGTWHERRAPWGDLAILLPWALGQQFALQTVLLREAQATLSRRTGIWVAALVFGVLHLPNPFLAPATCLGALAWCWIYDRHPNVLPLALSHAVLTLAILYSFDDSITGRLRVGYGYLMLP